MEELLQMIQQDPELWELVEQLKHQDEDPSDFILNVDIFMMRATPTQNQGE